MHSTTPHHDDHHSRHHPHEQQQHHEQSPLTEEPTPLTTALKTELSHLDAPTLRTLLQTLALSSPASTHALTQALFVPADTLAAAEAQAAAASAGETTAHIRVPVPGHAHKKRRTYRAATLQGHCNIEGYEDNNRDQEGEGDDGEARVLVPRYAHCARCHGWYDILLNLEEGGREACAWHPGVIEVLEEDFADDDDEPLDPVLEHDFRFEEYPESFIWSCCRRKANGEPCVRGRHGEKGQ